MARVVIVATAGAGGDLPPLVGGAACSGDEHLLTRLGGQRVQQHKFPGVARAQTGGGDPRADDAEGMEARSDELSGRPPAGEASSMHHADAGTSSASSAFTRSSIWSRIARTFSTLLPAGSGSSQSR